MEPHEGNGDPNPAARFTAKFLWSHHVSAMGHPECQRLWSVGPNQPAFGRGLASGTEETVTSVECHGNITVPYTTRIRHPPEFRLSPQAHLIEANARSGVRRASVDATLRTDSVNLCCSFACLTTPVLGSRWCAPPHTHTGHRGHGSCNVERAGGFWGGSVEAGASPGEW